MNPRHWLLNHPVVLRSAALMVAGGLTPDTICRSIDEALKVDLPSERERGEVVRCLRRTLKRSAQDAPGTIESDGMEDAEHSPIPSNK